MKCYLCPEAETSPMSRDITDAADEVLSPPAHICPHILAACAAPLPAIGLLTFEQQVIPGEPSPKNGYR